MVALGREVGRKEVPFDQVLYFPSMHFSPERQTTYSRSHESPQDSVLVPQPRAGYLVPQRFMGLTAERSCRSLSRATMRFSCWDSLRSHGVPLPFSSRLLMMALREWFKCMAIIRRQGEESQRRTHHVKESQWENRPGSLFKCLLSTTSQGE